MGIIWTIIIGFIAGVIAKLVTPGSKGKRNCAPATATPNLFDQK